MSILKLVHVVSMIFLSEYRVRSPGALPLRLLHPQPAGIDQDLTQRHGLELENAPEADQLTSDTKTAFC